MFNMFNIPYLHTKQLLFDDFNALIFSPYLNLTCLTSPFSTQNKCFLTGSQLKRVSKKVS